MYKKIVLVICLFIPLLGQCQPYVDLSGDYSKAFNGAAWADYSLGFKVSTGYTYAKHFNIGVGYSYKRLFPNIMKSSLSTYFVDVQYGLFTKSISPYIRFSTGAVVNKLDASLSGIDAESKRASKGFFISPALGILFDSQLVDRLCTFLDVSYDNYFVDEKITLLSANVGIKYRFGNCSK